MPILDHIHATGFLSSLELGRQFLCWLIETYRILRANCDACTQLYGMLGNAFQPELQAFKAQPLKLTGIVSPE